MEQLIQEKLSALTSRAQQLAKEHLALKKDNAMLRKLNQDLIGQLAELNNQLKIVKLAQESGTDSGINKHELKNLIDGYIKEIDACLLLMEGSGDENGR